MPDEKETPNGEVEKVEFTPIQQEKLQTLIDAAYAKAFAKAEEAAEKKVREAQAESARKLEELTSQINELKKPKPAVKTDDDGTPQGRETKVKLEEKLTVLQTDYEKANARIQELMGGHQALVQERDAAKAELARQREQARTTRIEREFIQASRKFKFINPDQVFTLVKNDIDVDDEHGLVVKNPKTGRIMMDATLENPLPLEDYLTKWAEDNKNHIEATDAGGGTEAGASRRVVTENSKIPDFSKMSPKEFEDYKNQVRMKATA